MINSPLRPAIPWDGTRGLAPAVAIVATWIFRNGPRGFPQEKKYGWLRQAQQHIPFQTTNLAKPRSLIGMWHSGIPSIKVRNKMKEAIFVAFHEFSVSH